MATDAKVAKNDLAGDLIASAGLTVSSVFVPFSQSRNAREKMPSLNWRVTLQCRGRDVLTCDYSAGMGHCPAYRRTFDSISAAPADEKRAAILQECETGREAIGSIGLSGRFKTGNKIEPESRNVIESLFMDACAIEYPGFTEWCDGFGYSSDSISARKIYNECVAHAVAIRAALGHGAFESLLHVIA